MNVIAFIPARAGSRGLPGKNTLPIAGKPMILHTVEAAKGCRYVNEIWVSTNSPAIEREVHGSGCYIHQRDNGLATSKTTMRDVVRDFARQQGADHGDVLLVLYPTYPTRTAGHLDAIVSAYDGRPMIGLAPVKTHPYMCMTADDAGHPTRVIDHSMYRRQDYPECYEMTHAACMIPLSCVDELDEQLLHPDTVGFWVPREWDLVDVDSRADAERAERRMVE